ncbi:MAG: hypothetical protein M3R66_09595 [Actinomycetota bacterium]|nr:hypothetical protein [Actinomycetota bacterium]
MTDAAALLRVPVSDFVRSAVEERAAQVVAEQEAKGMAASAAEGTRGR